MPEETTSCARHAPWCIVSMLSHGVLALVCVFIVAVSVRTNECELLLISPPLPIETEPSVVRDRSIRPIPLDIRKSETLPISSELIEESTHDLLKSHQELRSVCLEMPLEPSVTRTIGLDVGSIGPKICCPCGINHRPRASGAGRETEDALKAALLWLARHQNADGSWSAHKHTGDAEDACVPAPGNPEFDVGLTGLSLLAFLGAGYTHLSRDVVEGHRFGDVVKIGLQFLMNAQDPCGRIGSDEPSKYMYNHLLGAFALSEAYGLTESPLVRDAAQRGVDFAVQAQNPGKAWRYSFRSGENDSSVTGWGMQLLKSAESAELDVPQEAHQGILSWYDFATESTYHYTGYRDSRRAKVVICHRNEPYVDHPTLSAIAGLTRMALKGKSSPHVRGAVELCLADLPEWDARDLKVDFYYWYYATYLMFFFDGPSGPSWKRWHDKLKPALLSRQNKTKKDCRYGSWEPVDRWSSEGGRVYTTATGALILEAYFRCSHALRWFYKE